MTNKRWRKWLGLAVLAIAVFGPPLAFGVSNLLLMSPMGRSFVATKIQRTLQLDTSVKGCSWSPWNGFTVYGLVIKQPKPLRKAVSAPLLTLESIRIQPEWIAMFDNRLAIRSVELRKPDLALAVELLSQIPSDRVEPTVVASQPNLAVMEPPTGETRQPPAAHSDAPPQTAVTPPTKSQPSPALVLTNPTVWVTFTDARLSIVSMNSKKSLCRISRINGRLPIEGKSAGSEVVLDGISVMENVIPSAVKIPVKWQAPLLNLGVIDTNVLGIDGKLEASISLTPGVPFLFNGIIPQQEGKEIMLSETLRAKLGSIAAQGQFHGYALAPGSWQGQGIIQTLSVDAQYADNKSHFHHGLGVAIFQQGVLSCPDARLIGDDISLLGNGMVLGDGRFATHFRIVASPETLTAISRFTQTDSSPAQLTPLRTPQRAALDMQAFGFPGKLYYQASPASKPVLLR